MAYIYETQDSRLGDGEQETWIFNVIGATDEEDARQQLLNLPLSKLPQTIHEGAFERDAFGIEVVRRFRDGSYQIRVPYATPQFQSRTGRTNATDLDPGQWTFGFDTSGATGKVQTSFDTNAYDTSGRNSAVDGLFGHGVNVTGRGTSLRVEGADVVIPALRFHLRYRFAAGALKMSYATKVMRLTGCVNSAPFPVTEANLPWADGQFAAGETLFLGASGQQQSTGEVDLSFQFMAAPNVFDFPVAGGDFSITKAGHDFVWFYYELVSDTTADLTVVNPKYALVERIYEFQDLNQIFTLNPLQLVASQPPI